MEQIVDGEMRLNALGEIVREEWEKSTAIRAEIEICEYVIMPNHIHAIVMIVGRGDRPVARTTDRPDARTTDRPDARTSPNGPKQKSIGALIAGFKSAATTRINQIRKTPGMPVWQRNYYEHKPLPITRTGDRPVAPTSSTGPKQKSIGALIAGFKQLDHCRSKRPAGGWAIISAGTQNNLSSHNNEGNNEK